LTLKDVSALFRNSSLKVTSKNFLLKERKEEYLKEEEVIHFLSNIIIVVHHLNSRGIYHRDLKPENFLIKSDENGKIYLHLSDFGLAKNTKPAGYVRETTPIDGVAKGTLEYIAPEFLIKGQLKKPDISK
jgi:serine/threonine protein kinase